MKLFVNFIIYFVIAVSAQIAKAEKQSPQSDFQYNIKERGDWVIPLEVPNINKRATDTDISWLLNDNQLLMKKNKVVNYVHRAIKVNSESGLNSASEFSIYFQPDYQTLDIHFIKRHRKSNSDDITNSSDIRLFQREENYSRGIYDGEVTAIVLLKDIQAGDIIEYAYSVNGRNPIYKDEYFAHFQINWAIPLERRYFRFITDKSLYHKIHGLKKNRLKTKHKSGEYTYKWDQKSIAAVDDEGEYPHWYNPYGVVSFSQYDRWQGVVNWAVDMYVPPNIDNKDLIALSDQWISESDSKEQYAEKVIKYAQNNIRYFGIEIGQNSHRPFSPDIVFDRKFGDCKDKTIFINALLGRNGINANAALVSTRIGGGIKDELPQLGAFNHVISTFNIAGKNYWVDGTRQLQYGSLDHLGLGNYKYALVVKAGNKSLTKINSEPKIPSISVNESFDLANFNKAVMLGVEFMYTYDDAENTRSTLGSEGIKKFSKGYKDLYSRQFPGIEMLGDVNVHDDQENNKLKVSIAFKIQDFWDQSNQKHEVPLYGDLIEPYIRKPSVVDRAMPLAIYYPIDLEHTIEIKYSDPIDWDLADKDIAIENEAVAYRRKLFEKNNSIKISHLFKTKKDFIASGNVSKHIKDVNEIRDALFYSVSIDKPGTFNINSSTLKDSLKSLLKRNRN